MTPAEHRFLLGLYAKQLQMSTIICDLLESRGIASDDDLEAFEFAVNEDVASTAELFERAKLSYVKFATSLGMETGLEMS